MPTSLSRKQSKHTEAQVRMPLSGSRVWDDPTAQTRTKEAPRRHSGTRLPASRVQRGAYKRGPRPTARARGPLNGVRTRKPSAERLASGNGWREEQHERRMGARKSLSGSCAGDYLTATSVKEKPRRQTTGARLRVTIGHDQRGPRPPVCAHGPLNDARALPHPPSAGPSHFRIGARRLCGGATTFRNGLPAERAGIQPRGGVTGTSHRRAAF